jgi:phosphate transport system permease protein
MPRSIRSVDRAFFRSTGAVALLLVLLVVAIAGILAYESRLSIQTFGFKFWATSTWDPVMGQFGAFPFIWGTLYSAILALMLATPVALGIAIFLSELCPNWLRTPLTFLTELLAAIPSIVYGLWGVFILVPALRQSQEALPEWVRELPLFSGPAVGVSLLTASVVLAIMIIPFTSSVAREVLKAVPPSQREGAYAMGATRWEATKAAIFYARTGIIGAILLGFGRAIGETMAVTMVIGNRPSTSWSLFEPQYTMAAVIANEFAEAADDLHLSALIEVGLVLFTITLLINLASRLLIWNMTRQRAPRPTLSAAVPAEESAA